MQLEWLMNAGRRSTRAPGGGMFGPAGRGGGGGQIPSPLPNSQTRCRSEVDQAAIEGARRVLESDFKKSQNVTCQVKVRSKVKIVTYRLIGY